MSVEVSFVILTLFPETEAVNLPDKPLIADEVALGVTYDEIDDYLEGKSVSEKARTTIENWWHKTEHKRHLPITIFDDFWK